MNTAPEMYMLKPESLKIVIDRLPTSKKNDCTIAAFYFMYGIAKMVDGVKTGDEFYDYLQRKSMEFFYRRRKIALEYMEKIDKKSDLYELGKRLICTFNEVACATICYNNEHRKEVVEIFNKELF